MDAASLLVLGLQVLLHTWGANAAVEVNMEDKVEVSLGETAQITCLFTSDDGIGGSGGMEITWFAIESSGGSQQIYKQDSLQSNVEKNTPYTDRITVNNTGTPGAVVLTITGVQLSDEAEFSCYVRSLTDGTGEGRTRLRVFKAPDYPTIEGVKQGISVNDPASKIAFCEVKNGYPKPEVTWYRDNTPLRNAADVEMKHSVTSESSGLFSIHSDLIMEVKKEDTNATFYCEVKFFVPGAAKMYESDRINITVFYPPTKANLWIDSPKGKIKEGDTVELHCNNDGTNPSQETTIRNSQDENLGGATVVLEEVTRLDSGVYKCNVMDLETYEEFTANATVFVNYLEEAVIKPKHVLLEQKKELSATCNALSSLSTKTTWFKNGKEVSKGHHLDLKDVTYDNAGMYVCVVTVPEIEGMQSNASLQVHVEGPPEITEKDLNEKETAEKEVELSCHVRGYPTPEITWTTSEGKVIDSASQAKTDMGVKSVVKVKVNSDMTVFCNSSNKFGADSVTYNIKTTKHTTTPASTTTTNPTTIYRTTITAANTSANVTTGSTKTPVKADTPKPKKTGQQGSYGVIIPVIIICILLLAILGSVLYFLYKKGKICNRSGKKDFTKESSGKDKIVVEMKSDNTEEAILLGVNGEKQLRSDQ